MLLILGDESPKRFWTMRQGYLAQGDEVIHNVS